MWMPSQLSFVPVLGEMATGGSTAITASLHSGSYIREGRLSLALGEAMGSLCLGWRVPMCDGG